MKVTSDLVPYVVKRFKVLSLKKTDTTHELIYVDQLDTDHITQLEEFIGTKVVLKKQLPESQFWKLASETYKDISFPTTSKIEETPIKIEEKTPTQQTETFHIENIPTDILVKEIRRRQMQTKAEALITITPENTAKFEFRKLAWPVGSYRVSMDIIEELPIQEVTND